jgi:Hint domain-containing protein
MTSPPICFLRGTQILTSKGEICVEDLSIGDVVETVRGDAISIRWIGRQLYKKAAAARWHESVLPVRISRLALNEKAPHRDLYLSPGHRVFLDRVLIPAKYLINGTSITQAIPQGIGEIEYFHIELESHEVIFAEGAAAETLLVTNVQREHFSNFVEYERLYGIDRRPAMLPYAPAVGYNGRRQELTALLRRAASPIFDVRDPIQVAYDRIVKLGLKMPLATMVGVRN